MQPDELAQRAYISVTTKSMVKHLPVLRRFWVSPFRTAVPFRGHTPQISSSLSPKRDCGSEGVDKERQSVKTFSLLFVFPPAEKRATYPDRTTKPSFGGWDLCDDYDYDTALVAQQAPPITIDSTNSKRSPITR